MFVNCQENKRGKVSSSYFDVDLDLRLNDYSQDKDEMCKVNLKYSSSPRKKDTASVPVELWTYWLNAGTQVVVTSNFWDKYVVVLQDKFLLLRWRMNFLRCFGKWLARRLTQVKNTNSEASVIDIIVREHSPEV